MSSLKKIKHHKNILEMYTGKISYTTWAKVNFSKHFDDNDRCGGYFFKTDHLIIGKDELLNNIIACSLPKEDTVTILWDGQEGLNYQNNPLFPQLFKNAFGESYENFFKRQKRKIYSICLPAKQWTLDSSKIYSIEVDTSKKRYHPKYKYHDLYIKENPLEVISKKNYFSTPTHLIYDEKNEAVENKFELKVFSPYGKTFSAAHVRTNNLEEFFEQILKDLNYLYNLSNKS